jgi:hypothetical protein
MSRHKHRRQSIEHQRQQARRKRRPHAPNAPNTPSISTSTSTISADLIERRQTQGAVTRSQ